MTSRASRVLVTLVWVAGIFLVWELAAFVLDEVLHDRMASRTLPYLNRVAAQIAARFGLIGTHAAETLSRAFLGFAAGTAAGFLLALLMSASGLVERAVFPYLLVSQMIPILGLAPILAGLIGNIGRTRVFIAAFITFFPVAANTLNGFKSAGRDKRDLLYSLAAGTAHVYGKLLVPQSLPYLFAGMKIAAPMAITAAILVDTLGGASGLGYLITYSLYGGLPIIVFWCAVLLSAALGILAYYAIVLAERVCMPYKYGDSVIAKGALAVYRFIAAVLSRTPVPHIAAIAADGLSRAASGLASTLTALTAKRTHTARDGVVSAVSAINARDWKRSVLPPLVFGLLIIVMGETRLLHRLLSVSEVQLPPASVVLRVIAENLPRIAADTLVTVRVFLAGLGIGSLAGFLVAVFAVSFPLWGAGGLSVVSAFNAVPIVALSPIMRLWFSASPFAAKTAVVALVCMAPMSVNAFHGLSALPPYSLDLMDTYAADKRSVFFKLRLPNSLPQVFAALKINIAAAMIGVIISEYFAASVEGLGFVIRNSLRTMQLTTGWAYILVASLLGIAFFAALSLWEKRLFRHRQTN